MISQTALRRSVLNWVSIFGVMVLGAPGMLAAQDRDWALKMFDEPRHDFGTVATGSECKHRFKITNLYKDDVHIHSVRTSCSCARAETPEKTVLKSHESTYIEVSMDTQRFQRHKDSNLIVSVSIPPQYAEEVRIPLSVYIRTDVVMTPGSVNFGAVEKGASEERKIEVNYAGRSDWKIQDVVTNNKYLAAKIVEKARDQFGRVGYELFVTLKDNAPVGTLRQHVMLMTDDQNSPQVPVLVQARIEADISVTPSLLTLGTMKPGSARTVNFVLRGRKPFTIEKIEVDSDHENCKAPPMPTASKPLHMLPITITAPQESGPFLEKFTVTIAGRPEPLTFSAKGNIATTAAAN